MTHFWVFVPRAVSSLGYKKIIFDNTRVTVACASILFCNSSIATYFGLQSDPILQSQPLIITNMADSAASEPPTDQVANLILDEVTGEKV